ALQQQARMKRGESRGSRRVGAIMRRAQDGDIRVRIRGKVQASATSGRAEG
ncbi:hypothetical protein KI387_042523, partial [Taxus chinensis]